MSLYIVYVVKKDVIFTILLNVTFLKEYSIKCALCCFINDYFMLLYQLLTIPSFEDNVAVSSF
jgi:hypothetical protein